MKIDASITLLFSDGGMTIELFDERASVKFAEITLNQRQTCQALSRLSNTACTRTEVHNLDRVGLAYEHRKFTFPLGADIALWGKDLKRVAEKAARKLCPEGWTPRLYFNSQDSFFNEGGKVWARTIIQRWVKKKSRTEE